MNPSQWPMNVGRLLVIVLVMLMVTANASAEWKEKVLYSFRGGPDNGSVPAGVVVFDKQGNLYGVTSDGGGVYQLTPPPKNGGAWTETVLYVFQGNTKGDGATPEGGLVIDSAGNLYGTTAYGGTGNCVLLGILVGCGTVYELLPPKQKGGDWTETVLYSFPTAKQGYFPWGDLAFDRSGNLYGATQFGGGKGTTCNQYFGGNCGSVFELSPPQQKGGKWTEKILHSFAGGTGGAMPNGGLVLDSKGAIYGTTFAGGYDCPHNSGQGCGTVFGLAPPAKGGQWSERVLYRFKAKADGANPAAGMISDARGNLYGTSDITIFRMTPPKTGSGIWKQTILHTFNNDAYDPKGALIFDQSGSLHGTTYVGGGKSLQGSVFGLKPPTKNGRPWTFAVIHGFLGPPDGDFPAASVIFDKHGGLYSTTQQGGTGQSCQGGCGTVFEIKP